MNSNSTVVGAAVDAIVGGRLVPGAVAGVARGGEGDAEREADGGEGS